MRWFKRDMWKAGIAVAGMLLLLVLMVWVPVSVAGAQESASGLATPVTGTMQATPTVDPTMTVLQKEQLALQNKQLQQSNDRGLGAWLWSNAAAIVASFLSTLVVVVGALIGFWQWRVNRNDTRTNESNDRKEAQDKELRDRAEERFKTAVTALGDDKEGTQVGGAVLLRSFLNKEDKKSYERYYLQIFDLAVAYLCLSRTSKQPEDPDGLSHLPEDSDAPLPPTTLSQALIIVFKEAFPLARSQNQGSPQSLDAAGVQLDNAYLRKADLKQVWMPQASLRKATLRKADLRGAILFDANLSGANLIEAKLSGADLYRADFREANLRGADLSRADLREAKLSGADLWKTALREAKLQGANLEEALSLEDTDLHGVKGLTKEQLAACKAKGATIDEDSTTSSSLSTVSPSAPSESRGAPAPSAPLAQVNTPTPGTDGSAATFSQPGTES